MRGLLLLFIILPVIEMWILLEVGSQIGALPTISLVLLTAAIGFQMLRKQGFDTLQRGNFKMEQGEMPAQEMFEGLILAVSGALLLTPGFITDVIGFSGLTPSIRRWLCSKIASNITLTTFSATDIHTQTYSSGETYQHADTHRDGHIDAPSETGDVIDGEFRREE